MWECFRPRFQRETIHFAGVLGVPLEALLHRAPCQTDLRLDCCCLDHVQLSAIPPIQPSQVLQRHHKWASHRDLPNFSLCHHQLRVQHVRIPFAYHSTITLSSYMYMVLMTLLPFFFLLCINAIIVKRQSKAKSDETAPKNEGTSDDTITMIMVVILFLACNTLVTDRLDTQSLTFFFFSGPRRELYRKLHRAVSSSAQLPQRHQQLLSRVQFFCQLCHLLHFQSGLQRDVPVSP